MSDDRLEPLIQCPRDFVAERDWDQFHSPKNLSMAMIVEAAELVEHFQWLTEAQSRTLSASQHEAVRHELADIFIYLLRLAEVLDVDLIEAAHTKIAINAKKYPADRVRGSHAKYTAYEAPADEGHAAT